ncbi:hypothetical protein QBC40DRAFT_328633 [Triangularia verruculosa]|uniref:Uncharacterized protein n=1 Tax=Triangularia verruculosa TaxID=2587418 RepID=A0AAN6XG30_9PEZI|nr:hypothetical protein QBC40DRAFT_328633 [Triangularia verruculosa]
MVSLRSLTTFLLSLTPTVLAVTPSTVVNNLEALKNKSIDLQVPAREVNLINAQLFVLGRGPIPGLITQYNTFIDFVDGLNAAYQGSPPFAAGDAIAATIPNAFRGFTREHSILLNILIGNARLAGFVPGVGVLPPLNTAMGTVLSKARAALETYTARVVALTDAAADSQIEGSGAEINGTYTVTYNYYQNGLLTDILG